jgi:formamidopyrimidine-DNA glycosylase
MPELPEVQMVVTTLRPRLLGRPIRRVRVLRADIIRPKGVDLAPLLQDRQVTEIARRAKRIVITLDGQQRFYVHLGMTGRLTMEAAGSPLAPHTHLVLEMDDASEVHFHDPRRFGGVWWLGTDALPEAKLGPEPFDLSADQLGARLAKTRRPVKTALLDQSLIAGLGNIYADEALFTAGIHPLTPANALRRKQVEALNRAIKATLNRAIRHKGSTLRDYRDADGKPGDFQKLHRVYDRAGNPCVNCGKLVKRLVIGGRSAHFCPKCQKPPRKRP